MAKTITTGKARLTFINVVTPDADDKYTVTALIPKTDTKTLDAIRAEIEACKVDPKSIAKWGGKYIPAWGSPLRDGDTDRDTEKNPYYKGHYFIAAKTNATDPRTKLPNRKPQVVGPDLQPITDPTAIYSGIYGRISFSLGAYNYVEKSKKGISVFLNNVQKLEDGERLGGSFTNAADDFTAVEEDFLA